MNAEKRSPATVWWLVGMASLVFVACKRSPATIASDALVGPTAATVAIDPNADPNADPNPDPNSDPNRGMSGRELPSADPSQRPRVEISSAVTTPGKPGEVRPVDRFEQAAYDARAGAVSCFASLPSAEYAATLVIKVTPSGRVSRALVERGNVDDESVLSCLKTHAEGRSFPTSPEGRTVRVDVRVKAKPQ